MLRAVQVASILVLALSQISSAVKPPGYVKPPEVPDKNPPKYEYAYNIEDDKGTGQGKQETRDGIYALGRYYVQGKDASSNVQYYADDWGYHPYIEYSNRGPHSKSSTQLLLGAEAVKALASNKFTQNNVAPQQHVAETINKINENQAQNTQNVQQQQQPQQQQLIELQPQQQQQQYVEQKPQQQQLVELQPQQQQQYVEQQPQQQLFEQQLPFNNFVDNSFNSGIKAELVQENFIVPQQQQQQQFESATLYTDTKSNSQQVNYQQTTSFDQSSLSGDFGAKLNVVQKPGYVENSVQIQHAPSKLISSTRNLVSGQDVLNINGAVVVESSTPKTVVNDIHIHKEQLAELSHESLIQQPIVVADLDEKNYVSSTTAKYELQETVRQVTEPSDVLVTPRPVSTNFLAPITAGIQLQSIETKKLEKDQHAVEVDIQKSVPFFVGKYEYVHNNPGAHVEAHQKTVQQLVAIPQPLVYHQEQQLPHVHHHHNIENNYLVQQLPETYVKENFVGLDHHHHHVLLQQPQSVVVEKIVEKKVPYPVVQTKIVEKPVEVTKYVNTPYPVHVQVPVEKIVEKKVPYPVTVEKIVEKPVTVTKYIEKPVHIPQPYPVEKIVEKQVRVPVEVTKYVDRPYPVEVKVPYEVKVPVEVEKIVEKIVKQPYPVHVKVPYEVKVPYPVEKIVEKPVTVTKYIEKPVHIPQPYPVEKIVEKQVRVPVEVTKYVDRPYPVQVKVPYEVKVPVEKIVEKQVRVPVEVTKYVDRPYPVQVKVPYEVKVPVHVEKIVEKKVAVPHYIEKKVPVTVEKIVEKPVAHYIDRPYPVQVQVPVPQPYYLPYQAPQQHVHVQKQEPHIHRHYDQQLHEQKNSYVVQSYAPTHVHGYLPPQHSVKVTNGYLPPQVDCDQQHSHSVKTNYFQLKPQEYIGLLPPKYQTVKTYPRRFRSARSNNFNHNLRLEYGFMPPLIPSLEIDENGKPVDKHQK